MRITSWSDLRPGNSALLAIVLASYWTGAVSADKMATPPAKSLDTRKRVVNELEICRCDGGGGG
jgi:hypothetical protein